MATNTNDIELNRELNYQKFKDQTQQVSTIKDMAALILRSIFPCCMISGTRTVMRFYEAEKSAPGLLYIIYCKIEGYDDAAAAGETPLTKTKLKINVNKYGAVSTAIGGNCGNEIKDYGEVQVKQPQRIFARATARGAFRGEGVVGTAIPIEDYEVDAANTMGLYRGQPHEEHKGFRGGPPIYATDETEPVTHIVQVGIARNGLWSTFEYPYSAEIKFYSRTRKPPVTTQPKNMTTSSGSQWQGRTQQALVACRNTMGRQDEDFDMQLSHDRLREDMNNLIRADRETKEVNGIMVEVIKNMQEVFVQRPNDIVNLNQEVQTMKNEILSAVKGVKLEVQANAGRCRTIRARLENWPTQRVAGGSQLRTQVVEEEPPTKMAERDESQPAVVKLEQICDLDGGVGQGVEKEKGENAIGDQKPQGET